MASKKLVKGTTLGAVALSTIAVAANVQADEGTATQLSPVTSTLEAPTTTIQTVDGVAVSNGTAVVTETPTQEMVIRQRLVRQLRIKR